MREEAQKVGSTRECNTNSHDCNKKQRVLQPSNLFFSSSLFYFFQFLICFYHFPFVAIVPNFLVSFVIFLASLMVLTLFCRLMVDLF
jgi:hypothetical protein